MPVIQFGVFEIIAEYEKIEAVKGGYIISGDTISLLVPQPIQNYYTHGWQSWSLAAWTKPAMLPQPRPALLNPMQVDPVYVKHPNPNGSWIGAVELTDGNILLLGALHLDSHVQLRNGCLQGWSDDKEAATPQRWFIGLGAEIDIFGRYAEYLRQQFGQGRAVRPWRVWCSWYSLYTAVDENSLHTIFSELKDLPFDVLQVDDGWQKAIGDWQANDKFPSGMQALAKSIKITGRKAGLWLAPLLVVPSSETFRQHPDWVLRDVQGQLVNAGFNWGARKARPCRWASARIDGSYPPTAGRQWRRVRPESRCT